MDFHKLTDIPLLAHAYVPRWVKVGPPIPDSGPLVPGVEEVVVHGVRG